MQTRSKESAIDLAFDRADEKNQPYFVWEENGYWRVRSSTIANAKLMIELDAMLVDPDGFVYKLQKVVQTNVFTAV